MQNDLIILFHTNAKCKGEVTYYCKGKMYTEAEYWEMWRRKQKIKDTICHVITTILFVAFMIYRGYVFVEYVI